MVDGERAPGPGEAGDPAGFLARLQALKDWTGLTYRELSARAEAVGDSLPRSTVANMLSRSTLPREELLAAFVRACGAGPEELERWLAVRKELAARHRLGPRPEPPEPPAGEGSAPGRPPATAAGPDAPGRPAPAVLPVPHLPSTAHSGMGPRSAGSVRVAGEVGPHGVGPSAAGVGGTASQGVRMLGAEPRGAGSGGGPGSGQGAGAGGPHGAGSVGGGPGGTARGEPFGEDPQGAEHARAQPTGRHSVGAREQGVGPHGADSSGVDAQAVHPGGAEPSSDPQASGAAPHRAGSGPGYGPAAGPGTVGADGARTRVRTRTPGAGGKVAWAAVAVVGGVALVVAVVSVVALLRGADEGGHRGRAVAGPAAGAVQVRAVHSGLCLNERPGQQSGVVYQVACADAVVPRYSLVRLDGGLWRLRSDHPDFGPGCSGVSVDAAEPDGAPLADQECGKRGDREAFRIEALGDDPVRGYRLRTAYSGLCLTVSEASDEPWTDIVQKPCTPDGAGQLFSFDPPAHRD